MAAAPNPASGASTPALGPAASAALPPLLPAGTHHQPRPSLGGMSAGHDRRLSRTSSTGGDDEIAELYAELEEKERDLQLAAQIGETLLAQKGLLVKERDHLQQQLEDQAAEFQQTTTALRESNEGMQAQLSQLLRTVEKLKDEQRQAQTNYEVVSGQLEIVENQRDKIKSSLQERIDKLAKEAEELRRTVSEVVSERDGLQDQLRELENSDAVHTKEAELRAAECRTLKGDIAVLQAEHDRTLQEVTDQQTRLTQLTQITAERDRLRGQVTTLQDADAQRQKFARRVSQLEADNAALRTTTEDLQRQLNEMAAQAESLGRGRRDSMIPMEDGTLTLVDPSAEATGSLAADAGMGSLLGLDAALDSFPAAASEPIQVIKSAEVQAQEAREALQKQVDELQHTVQELQGELRTGQTAHEEAVRRLKSAETQRDQVKAELRERIERASKESDALRQELAASQQQVSEMEAAATRLQQQLDASADQLQSEVQGKQQLEKRLVEKLETLQRSYSELAIDRATVAEQSKTAQVSVESLKSQLQLAESHRDQLKASLQERTDKLSKEADELRRSIADLNAEKDRLQDQLHFQEATAARHARAAELITIECAELKMSLSDFHLSRDQRSSEVSQLRAKLDLSNKTAAECERLKQQLAALQDVEHQRLVLFQQVTELESENDELRASVEELQQQLESAQGLSGQVGMPSPIAEAEEGDTSGTLQVSSPAVVLPDSVHVDVPSAAPTPTGAGIPTMASLVGDQGGVAELSDSIAVQADDAECADDQTDAIASMPMSPRRSAPGTPRTPRASGGLRSTPRSGRRSLPRRAGARTSAATTFPQAATPASIGSADLAVGPAILPCQDGLILCSSCHNYVKEEQIDAHDCKSGTSGAEGTLSPGSGAPDTRKGGWFGFGGLGFLGKPTAKSPSPPNGPAATDPVLAASLALDAAALAEPESALKEMLSESPDDPLYVYFMLTASVLKLHMCAATGRHRVNTDILTNDMIRIMYMQAKHEKVPYYVFPTWIQERFSKMTATSAQRKPEASGRNRIASLLSATLSHP